MVRCRGIWWSLVVLVGLGARARAEDTPQKKQKREQALAAAEKQVRGLEAMVKRVGASVGCPTPATTPTPTTTGADAGKVKLKINLPPFCMTEYEATRDKIIAFVEEADAVAENDARTGWVRTKWVNDYLGRFEKALAALVAMRGWHLAKNVVGRQCKKISDTMVARARTAAETRSLDEFQAARDQAQRDRTLVNEWISAQESTATALEQLNVDAHVFQPAGGQYDKPWEKVVTAIDKSSTKMLADWKAAWKKGQPVCAEPAKGQDHAEHRASEDRMYFAIRKQLEVDLVEVRKEITSYFKMDCDSMQKLHDLWCEVDGDGEEADELQSADAISDRLAEVAVARSAAVIPEVEQLVLQAGQLEAVLNGRMEPADLANWRADIQDYITKLVKIRTQFDRRVLEGVVRGAVHPMRQVWMSFGVKQHKALEDNDTFACSLKDKGFCAHRDSNGKCEQWRRPDCVSLDNCTIYEFKPPGGSARKRGLKQLADYKEMVETHYNFALNLHRNNDLTYTPIGGVPLLEALAKSCAPDGKIEFETTLVQYDECDKYQCSSDEGQ